MAQEKSSEIIAYIECSPYPLTQLNKDEEFTIGRGVYNRLVLSLDNVSRYHAVIRWKNNRFILEDLGSSNGTFVNDQIIEKEYILESGDEIQIGNQLLTYRESRQEGEFHNLKTLKANLTKPKNFRLPSVEEIKNLRTSLQGNIETIPLFSVLQMLGGDNQTGCLTINKDSQVGKIYFKKGNIVDCKLDENRGEQVFFEIIQWEKGRFQFSKEEQSTKETMNENLQKLLLEGLRILDESNSA